MKKWILLLCGLAVQTTLFAQGYINWTGAGPSLIVQTNGWGSTGPTLPNNAANNAALGYQGYYYELLTSTTATSAPTTLADFSAWFDTGLSATNSPNAGRIIQVNGTPDTQVNNWPVGNTQAVVLAGWSANLGATWSTALNRLQNWNFYSDTYWGTNAVYFGVSSFGSGVQAVAGSVVGNEVINVATGQIYNPSSNPMMLNEIIVVPEPGTLALAALGGASLLLFRRKK